MENEGTFNLLILETGYAIKNQTKSKMPLFNMWKAINVTDILID